MGARLAGLWRRLFDAFVRDNKVLPPVLALLALLLFAWVAAGLFMGGPEDEGVSSGNAELVQSRDPNAGADAPEVEDRNADSYAAYRNKDPFRQLLAPASESTGESTSAGAAPEDGTTPPGSAPPGETTDPGGGGGGPDTGGGDRSQKDSDGDGLTNRDEERLGQDPRNPDTDGDSIPDGQDDADGDGTPDGEQGGGQGSGQGSGQGGGQGSGGSGGGGSGGGGSGSDDLFDSGGTLLPR